MTDAGHLPAHVGHQPISLLPTTPIGQRSGSGASSSTTASSPNLVSASTSARSALSAAGRLTRRFKRRTPTAFTAHRNPSRTGTPPWHSADLLARTFRHPQGAGVTGEGAHAFMRAALVETLMAAACRIRVVVTRADLKRLFGREFDGVLVEAFAPHLHVADLLEDAIEHLEREAAEQRQDASAQTRTNSRSQTVWFATPGMDADVVHQTVQLWQDLDLIALLSGPWPYGPTHLFEADGQQPAYDGERFRVLTHHEAVELLRAHIASQK